MSWKGKPADEQPDQTPEDGPSRERTVGLPNFEDEETGWFRQWYFVACLSDTLADAHRNGQEATLIYFRLPLSAWIPTSRLRLYLTLRLQLLQREVRPGVAIFGRLEEDEFAICVTNTGEFGANATAMLILHTLAGLSAETSSAEFPRDGEDRVHLLGAARRVLEERPSNVIDFELFRRRRRPRAA